MICGIIHGDGVGVPTDKRGCHLPNGHAEPHEYTATDGLTYQWETDLLCECDHCMKAEGDYCTTYWKREIATQGAETPKPGGAL